MAVSTRMTAPNYKIFEPDSLDAIYAKGNLDPIMGGISYAFGNAHKAEAAGNQADYMQSQEKFNKMAAALDAMEIDSKTKQEALKIGGKLVELGEDPTKVLGSEGIYSNPADSLLPGLLRGKIQSEITRNNAAGTADRNKDTDTFKTTTVDPATGTVVEQTSKRKPGQLDMTPPNAGGNPKGSTPIPQKDNSAVLQQQIQTRAKAVAGPDAKLIDSANGATLWKGSKGIVTFDPTGKQVR